MKMQLTMSNQSIQTYKSELIKCYNLAFGTNYDTSYNFLNDELFELTPAHFYSYLSLKIFGTTSPLATEKATQGRSSIIEYSKRAILYFMPNKLVKWDLQGDSGNPTISVIINELIKRVKKHKIRREGKASSTC